MSIQDANKVPLWHTLPPADALRQLDSDAAKGLNPDEAMRRLEKYGLNRLPDGAKRGPFARFLLQFDNILVYVLLAAGFVKLMLGLWLDASIITGVVGTQRGSWLHPGRQGGAGAQFDPQYAFRGSQNPARRTDLHSPR